MPAGARCYLSNMKHNPAFLALVNDAKTRVKACSVAEVHARLEAGERFHFVDVREDSEAAVDMARGARHIGRGVLERDVETLIPDQRAPIVLYCGGGFRSALAADNLQRMGYTDVVSMDGGMRAWREAGYPVERGGK
jgi:rhodanese-related sulfurtransferase